MGRWTRRILQLDPVADHAEIYRISAGHEFPWDHQRALEFALLRTYCVPSISALLDATGEFRDRPQRRYDDTALLMAELAAHGYDSPRGREALRVINRAHGRYAISNDDMRYVLSTFVYDPIDWIDRYGWRRLTDHERVAAFEFYRAVGRRMGIQDVPDTFEEFRRFKTDYEAATFRYSDANRRIAQYTIGLLAGWFPAPLRPAVRLGVRAMLEPPMLAAFGLDPAPRWVSGAARLGLRARAGVVRLLPPRRRSRLGVDPGNRTYPGYPTGYSPADLGAPPPPADLDPVWLRATRSPEAPPPA
ncbi:oxygenase MpaB family protein [Dactylosporangium sp. NPDC050688]|uniref:oxygenase MpaB family protein n=1 Tax=Dactylosporangium sp. NPDC050688 TaxID=3157217 RepID=UPI0033FA0AC8